VERACVGEDVKFVEEHAAVPQRLGFIIDVTRLPGVDGVAPGGGVFQGVAGDGPGVEAGRAVEVGVAAMPFAAGAELDDGEIPGDDHGNDARFSGLQGEADGDSTGDRFVAARPRVVAVAKAAVFSEGRPDVAAVAVRSESGLVGDL